MKVLSIRKIFTAAILTVTVAAGLTIAVWTPTSLFAGDVTIYIVFDDINDTYQNPPPAERHKDKRGWGDGMGGGKDHS